MLPSLLLMGDSYLLHPLRGLGYQFFSGIGSSINEWLQTIVVVGTFALLYVKRHNCHYHRCLRLSWHVDGNGHPICKAHAEDHPKSSGHLARLLTRVLPKHAGYEGVV